MSTDSAVLTGPVVVTGANGFIGRHLCRHLAAAGVDVHAVVRESTARPVRFPTGVAVHVVLDATAEYPAIATALRPDVVFHLATLLAPRHAASEIVRMVDANVAFGTVVCDVAVTVRAITVTRVAPKPVALAHNVGQQLVQRNALSR